MTGGQIKSGQQQRCGWLSTILEVTSNRSSWTQLLKERLKNQRNLKTFGFSILSFADLIMLNNELKSQQENMSSTEITSQQTRYAN